MIIATTTRSAGATVVCHLEWASNSIPGSRCYALQEKVDRASPLRLYKDCSPTWLQQPPDGVYQIFVKVLREESICFWKVGVGLAWGGDLGVTRAGSIRKKRRCTLSGKPGGREAVFL